MATAIAAVSLPGLKPLLDRKAAKHESAFFEEGEGEYRN